MPDGGRDFFLAMQFAARACRSADALNFEVFETLVVARGAGKTE